MAGAAIYVAEHAPREKRGQYTSWIQVSVVGGFLLCLVVVLSLPRGADAGAVRRLGLADPFPRLDLMLAISLYIRLKLKESPSSRR
jgi:hypothetical protein